MQQSMWHHHHPSSNEDNSQLCSVSNAKVFMSCVPTRAQRQLHQMELFHRVEDVDVILLAVTCEYDPNTYGKFIQTDIKRHHLLVGLSFLPGLNLSYHTIRPAWLGCNVSHLQVCVYRWKGWKPRSYQYRDPWLRFVCGIHRGNKKLLNWLEAGNEPSSGLCNVNGEDAAVDYYYPVK